MQSVPLEIHDTASASRFIAWCVSRVGPGYHPDTLFGDYLTDDGTRCFSDDEARVLDRASDAAFRYCDPYAVAFDAVQSFMVR